MFDFFEKYNNPTEQSPRADDSLGRVCPRTLWNGFLEAASNHQCYFITLTIDPKMKVNNRFLRQMDEKRQKKYLRDLYNEAIRKYERKYKTTCYYYNYYESQKDGTLHLHGMLYRQEDEKNIFNVPINLRYYFSVVGFRNSRSCKVEIVKYFYDCARYCSKDYGIKNTFVPFHKLETRCEANIYDIVKDI